MLHPASCIAIDDQDVVAYCSLLVTEQVDGVLLYVICSTKELEMSLRYWNSLAERARLCRLMTLSAILLEEDSDDGDGMSVDSSLSLESGQSLVSFLSLGLLTAIIASLLHRLQTAVRLTS